jgi:hypothetical protein
MELSQDRSEAQALHEHLPARRGYRFVREIEGFRLSKTRYSKGLFFGVFSSSDQNYTHYCRSRVF